MDKLHVLMETKAPLSIKTWCLTVHVISVVMRHVTVPLDFSVAVWSDCIGVIGKWRHLLARCSTNDSVSGRGVTGQRNPVFIAVWENLSFNTRGCTGQVTHYARITTCQV